MVPEQKVKDLIDKHRNLEKELSLANINPKLFAKKSKEYSNLGNIIDTAKSYINFGNFTFAKFCASSTEYNF